MNPNVFVSRNDDLFLVAMLYIISFITFGVFIPYSIVALVVSVSVCLPVSSVPISLKAVVNKRSTLTQVLFLSNISTPDNVHPLLILADECLLTYSPLMK